MSFNFDVERAAQLAAYCIRQSGSQQINTMKLLKLLYIADRESLRTAGYPLTGDKYFALKNGPILSHIYDLTKSDDESSRIRAGRESSIWANYFTSKWHELSLVTDPGDDQLSDHDKSVLDTVLRDFGSFDQFELVKETHKFPEWLENEPSPSGPGAREIPLRDTLKALDLGDQIEAIEQAQSEDNYFADLFGS